MKDYFKRLKNHAGLSTAFVLMIMGFLAGAGNKSFAIWWHGGLFGAIFISVFCFGAILLSNFKSE